MLIGIHRENRERSRSSSLSALPNGWALITLHRSVPGTSLVFLVTCIDIPLCHYFKPCSVISSCSASASYTTDISSHHSVIQCLSSHYMTKEHCHLLIVAYNSLLSFAFPKQSLLVIKSCNNCWVLGNSLHVSEKPCHSGIQILPNLFVHTLCFIVIQ